MLLSLHVKNLALIEETEVEFSEGLNILTGETGAGKSILIGSVNLALGAKAGAELIRSGADYALVELVFTSDARIDAKLVQMDLPSGEDTVVITRRIQAGRSVSRINGETVAAKQLKELSELLLDLHGQHEHQSLLHKKKHMEILDAYCGEDAYALLEQVKERYQERSSIRHKIEEGDMDEAARVRELELCSFEYQEIEDGNLKEGEDEELESRYRLMSNSRKIGEALGAGYRFSGGDEDGASAQLGRAVRELNSVAHYDTRLEQLAGQLSEIDSLLGDFNRDLADYLQDMEFDPADFEQTENRLNQVNHLKDKYGGTVEAVLSYKDNLSEKMERLQDHARYMERLKREYEDAQQSLLDACKRLSDLRKEKAKELSVTLKKAMEDLNFLTVDFEIRIEEKEPATDGSDDVEFLLSTNPGEARRPLGMVASGGELSRIMLAIKAVLAKKDAVDTLIFDEIDAGISGRTAWKVSEKLGQLANAHQVICITHLPQIAAMADVHFQIEKRTDGASTATAIQRLPEEEIYKELARLLGAGDLSEAALSNAKELKKEAAKIKQN